MDDQKNWEYCIVYNDNYAARKFEDKKMKISGYESDISISYMSESQVTSIQLTKPFDNKDKLLLPKVPINIILGQLGSFGWELIQIIEYTNISKFYLKRIISIGRPVTEPIITFPELIRINNWFK